MAITKCNYHVLKVSPVAAIVPTVWIIDDDLGGRSVTNDAEAVCKEMHGRYPHHRIIYRDSDGRWDELVHRSGLFKGYGCVRQDDPDLIP